MTSRATAPLSPWTPLAAPKVDAQLCFKVYAVNNLLGRLYRSLLEPLDLTYPQYLAMLVLWEVGEATVGELGRRLKLDSGTLTPLLKRLEAAKLVTRRRAQEDERRVVVSLTAAGVALSRGTEAIPRELACRIDDVVLRDAEEFNSLNARLQALIDALAEAFGDSSSRKTSPAAASGVSSEGWSP
jgi:DNA-binding MarR family transcriptional regulator